jgi:hypothetical protein
MKQLSPYLTFVELAATVLNGHYCATVRMVLTR